MIIASVFFVVSVGLGFIAKYYFKLLEKLYLKDAASSKLQMSALWLLFCFAIFLRAYIPIIVLKREAPNSDLKLGILPLLVSMIFIFIFQKNDIKRVRTLLNAKSEYS